MAKYCPYCVSRVESGNTCPYCSFAGRYRAKEYQLLPGTVLHNKYLVGRVLGEGGYGITYIGRDLTLDMKVAIKEYFPNKVVSRHSTMSKTISLVDNTLGADFKKGKEQFIYEAQTIAKMDKESAVVTVRDFFPDNNSAYIVMEFIEGQDLRNIMAERGKAFEPQELFDLLEPVFGALNELHEIGLIHRDISPDNIMVEEGRARLIDFGCARQTVNETINAETVLKHSFSPIEQYENADMGPWTDVYAMAATIYYCLTGRRAPVATERIVHDELIAPSALGVKLKSKQEHALLKALAVWKEDRYQTMEAFGNDLFIHRNRYKYIALAACGVAVLAIAAFLIWRPKDTIVVQQLENANPVVLTVGISDEDITADEKEVLSQLSQTMMNGELHYSGQGNSQYSYSMTNDTGFDLEEVSFLAQFKNTNGAIIRSASGYVSDWKKGQSREIIFYSGGKADSVEIRATIKGDEKNLCTEYIPVPLPDKEKVLITPATEFPVVVLYHAYQKDLQYIVTAFHAETDDWYGSDSKNRSGYIYIDGEYLSGPENEAGQIGYRITDTEGTVFKNGYFSIPKLKPGEKFANFGSYLSSLPTGEYYIEFTDN